MPIRVDMHLGADGDVRIEGIADGPCRVSFPELGSEAWALGPDPGEAG